MYKATWKREFKLPWREAGSPNHLDDKVDSDQYVDNKELSLSRTAGSVLLRVVLGDFIGKEFQFKTFWH